MPLDVQMLQAMPPGTRFATGVATDCSEGLFMANTGKELRWVAMRGQGTHDWAIYCHFDAATIDEIARTGDKVQMEQHIRFCVPCDDAALKCYRR